MSTKPYKLRINFYLRQLWNTEETMHQRVLKKSPTTLSQRADFFQTIQVFFCINFSGVLRVFKMKLYFLKKINKSQNE